jgi:hypothetical protein
MGLAPQLGCAGERGCQRFRSIGNGCLAALRSPLVFLEVRVIGGVGGWENLDVHANETIVWACLAFSILSADLAFQCQRLGRSPSVVRRHSPASEAELCLNMRLWIESHGILREQKC